MLKLGKDEQIDPLSSDMYSLGVIFYSLIKCFCEEDLRSIWKLHWETGWPEDINKFIEKRSADMHDI